MSKNKYLMTMEILVKVNYFFYLVDELTLKGLIYYLKVPKDKFNQEKRFR